MFQLRCTGKVIKTLGLKPQDLFDAKMSDSLLGDWYVNEFFLDRRKTFIFMSEKTLLSFIIYGIKKSNLGDFPARLHLRHRVVAAVFGVISMLGMLGMLAVV